jgi:hypothetical protein
LQRQIIEKEEKEKEIITDQVPRFSPALERQIDKICEGFPKV